MTFVTQDVIRSTTACMTETHNALKAPPLGRLGVRAEKQTHSAEIGPVVIRPDCHLNGHRPIRASPDARN